MKTLMHKVDRKFSDLFNDYESGLMGSNRFMTLAMSMLLILMQDIDRVNRELDQFLVGLRGLQQQEFSIDLILEMSLEQALRSFQKHIASEHPAFSFAEQGAVYYYKYGRPAYCSDNGTLIVYLNVPWKSSNTAFRLYMVSEYPIPAVADDS